MKPQDLAILKRIDATTRQNNNLSRTTLGMTQALMAMGGVIRQTVTATGKAVNKTWDFLQVDRILAVMTWIGTLHNAYFLSRNIAETLFYMVSQALNLIGVQNADGSPLDINAEIARFMNGAAEAMIGADNLNGIKEEWAQHSRTYQAATNLMYSIRNMTDSVHMALEGIGQYVAQIGNALKRSGTILETSFGFMNENVANVRAKVTTRWEKAFQNIEQIDNVVSSMAAITGDVVNIADSVVQVQQARQDFATAVEEESESSEAGLAENKLNSEAPISLENADPYTIGARE